MSTGLRYKRDEPRGKHRVAQRYGIHGTSFSFYLFCEFAGCVECCNYRHSRVCEIQAASESKIQVNKGEEEAVS